MANCISSKEGSTQINATFCKNFGLTSPLPTAALAVTALVGVLTAVFIFQSGSEKVPTIAARLKVED
ncbi:stress enhanced protein 1, partial [Prunus dulcis]